MKFQNILINCINQREGILDAMYKMYLWTNKLLLLVSTNHMKDANSLTFLISTVAGASWNHDCVGQVYLYSTVARTRHTWNCLPASLIPHLPRWLQCNCPQYAPQGVLLTVLQNEADANIETLRLQHRHYLV